MECGSEASAHAEANASALQTGQRAAPLSHAVGEGLGVRAESGRTLHTVNPSDVPLSANRGAAFFLGYLRLMHSTLVVSITIIAMRFTIAESLE